jgi:energy-coupling factor transporter ATP-binding protein EcfA2
VKLVSFQVRDFRSVIDSTVVKLQHRTVLVGRNESGKSALLKALHGLKAQDVQNGMPPFTLARDFPRDRPRKDFNPKAVVVETVWELSDGDRVALGKLWPRASTAASVRIRRWYEAIRSVSFDGLSKIEDSVEGARESLSKLRRSLATPVKDAADAGTPVATALDALDQELSDDEWEDSAKQAVEKLRGAITTAGLVLSGTAKEHLATLSASVPTVVDDETKNKAAREWAVQQMPVFVYLDEWDSVTGHHNIDEYLTHRQQNNLTDEDRLFAKLLKVADLNAEELKASLSQNHEERTLLTDRASRVMTRRLRELWKDREIEVQFRVDANHFDVLVKDRDTDALVPLDERSRGFRWYFSFFVTFTADTLGGDKANAVLLLDEPGLFLHATAQGQLLKFFKDLSNQLVYTTHSPFMIDPNDLGAVRTVTLETDHGTVVSEDLAGDARTLFPLQAALGYSLTQTLFVGTKNVVVEGVTDYWYMSSVADFLRDQGKPSLDPEIVLTPAGGAQKVSYLVALLTAQELSVVVLLDDEPEAGQARDELVKSKLIRGENVLKVTAAFDPVPSEADVEDILDPATFTALVREAYANELNGRTLTMNPQIPRATVRATKALEALGLPFHKSRVARLFVTMMASNPQSVLGGQTLDRFQRLFERVNATVTKMMTAGRPPFA